MTRATQGQHIDPFQKTAIVVLGGNLVKDGGAWRTAMFDEHDDFGCMGDRLRVIAASVLYKQLAKNGTEMRVLACGGRGQLLKRFPDVPAVAEVIARELEILGVCKSHILEEKKSENTYGQLRACDSLFRTHDWEDGVVISNEYHLPRVRALLRHGLALELLREKIIAGALTLLSAESILLADDKARWELSISKAYEGAAMRDRVALEVKGVHDIMSGLYTFT